MDYFCTLHAIDQTGAQTLALTMNIRSFLQYLFLVNKHNPQPFLGCHLECSGIQTTISKLQLADLQRWARSGSTNSLEADQATRYANI